MKTKTLMHSSILAAIIIAAVIGVGQVTGFPGAKPFISVDPVSDKNVGDQVTITGTTNLPAGSEILFQVYPLSYVPDSTNPQTGAQSGVFTGATGTVAVKQGTGDTNTWSADLDLSTFQSMEYLVNVSLFTGDAAKGDYSTGSPFGTTTFAVHPASGTPGTSQSSGRAVAGGILIDPILDTPQGKLLEVTGKTNLSVGTPFLVKVIPASFDNETVVRSYKNPENVAVIRVEKGDGINNQFSVMLDTRFLALSDHIIFVSEMNDEAAGINSEPARWTGSAIFNIIAPTAGTNSSKTDLSVPAVFINYINDVTAGDPITVTGTTNVPVGAKFQVSVVPAENPDFKHPEIDTTISAVKGSETANLFSVTLPTKALPPGQHIIAVSAYDYETTGTILFTVK